ncbi:Uncharacterised protein [Shigella sonnei]|nr:Uncharacterised protein [Shigella sonnei]
MRLAIINRKQRNNARTAHFHQTTNRGQRRFIGGKEIHKFAVLWAMILIG